MESMYNHRRPGRSRSARRARDLVELAGRRAQDGGHQGSHHVLTYAGPKIEQPFLPPTAPGAESLLIFAPNPRNKAPKLFLYTPFA